MRWWQVLAERDSQDPAVQEALLAIAYTQQRRRANDEAKRAYQAAISRYETETKRLAELEAALRATEVDPLSVLNKKAKPQEFASLRASHRFVQQLDDIESLQKTGQELETLGSRISQLPEKSMSSIGPQRADELRRRWQAKLSTHGELHAAAVAELRKMCLDDLQQRQTQQKAYLSRALLSLAVLYDKGSAP